MRKARKTLQQQQRRILKVPEEEKQKQTSHAVYPKQQESGSESRSSKFVGKFCIIAGILPLPQKHF